MSYFILLHDFKYFYRGSMSYFYHNNSYRLKIILWEWIWKWNFHALSPDSLWEKNIAFLSEAEFITKVKFMNKLIIGVLNYLYALWSYKAERGPPRFASLQILIHLLTWWSLHIDEVHRVEIMQDVRWSVFMPSYLLLSIWKQWRGKERSLADKCLTIPELNSDIVHSSKVINIHRKEFLH